MINRSNSGPPALRLDGVTKRFGGLVVSDDVSLSLGPGELRALIGPNGAGKSTLVNLITGFERPDGGRILLDGERIDALAAAERRRCGVARTFQTPRLFEGASVFDNVLLAVRFRHGTAVLARLSRATSVEVDAVTNALATVGMSHFEDVAAGSLPHGQKRLLEIAMAIAEPPKVLLLDEPTAGMSVRETEEVADVIATLRGGLAILVIDHDMSFIRRLDAPVTVLHEGAVVREGSIGALEKDSYVQDIYLGVPDSV